MTRGKIVYGSVLATAIFAGGVLVGQVQQIPAPRVTVGSNHRNLQAAQKAIAQAFNELALAQRENNDDLGGHANNAGKLLDEANTEVELAAEYANSHGH